MKSLPALILTALAFGIAAATGANAQGIVDMQGTWVAQGEGIVDLDGRNPHRPDAVPEPETSGGYVLDASSIFTYQIDGQDGRRFWGTVSTPNHSERLIGSFSVDGGRVYMIDDAGYYDGVVVDADTIDLCYRHITAENSVVDCGLLERQE